MGIGPDALDRVLLTGDNARAGRSAGATAGIDIVEHGLLVIFNGLRLLRTPRGSHPEKHEANR